MTLAFLPSTAAALRDPALPQMPIALDPECMARVFEDALADAGAAPIVERCAIQRVKYKPGKNCRVLYRLRLREAGGGAPFEHMLSARVFPLGASVVQFQKAAARPLVAPRLGPPLLHIAPLSLVAWAAPNDRKLRGLPALMDPARLRDDLLPELAAARFGPGWRIEDAAPSIAHLAPEYSACVRVHARLTHAETGARRSWLVFGKTYSDDRGEIAHRTMRRLWDSAERRRGALSIPAPLGYRPELNLLWQEGLPGRTMLEICGAEPPAPALAERLGRGVAALHGAEIDCPEGSGLPNMLARLRKLRGLLADALPSAATRTEALIARLTARACEIDAAPRANLHGDLHPKNVLVHGDTVSLIDLDDITRGPPSRDIGGFIAATLHRGLAAGAPRDRTAASIAAFLAGYRAAASWPTPDADIAWHTATALLIERAYRCVTRVKPGQFEIIEALIAMADDVARGACEQWGAP